VYIYCELILLTNLPISAVYIYCELILLTNHPISAVYIYCELMQKLCQVSQYEDSDLSYVKLSICVNH